MSQEVTAMGFMGGLIFIAICITAHQLWRIAEALEERNDEWRDDE